MWRSISRLSLATLLGQGVALAAIPVLTRIYAPDVYGNYQTLYAAVTILGAVASLRLERAIPLAEDEERARAVLAGAYLIAGSLMGIILVLAITAPQLSAALLGNEALVAAIWVVPVGGFLTSSYAIAIQWAVRERRHNSIAVRNAVQPTVMTLAQVLLGAVAATLSSLSLGLIIGRLVGALTAMRQLLRVPTRLRLRPIVAAMRRYRGFMFLSAPAALLNTAALQLPVILFGAIYGAESAGLYGMSAIITVAPVTLLAGATSQVLMGDIAERIRGKRAGVLRLVCRTSLLVSLLGVVAAVAVGLVAQFGPELLGGEWSDIPPYLTGLSAVLAVRLPANAVSPALSAFEKHHIHLAIDAARVAWVLFSIGLARSEGWPAESAVYLLVVGVVISYVVAIAATIVVSRNYERRV